jgi:hypothetical protein
MTGRFLEVEMRHGAWILAMVGVVASGCGKKAPSGPVVIEGWHKQSGWTGECYFPKNYKDSDRITQNEVREAMMSQWRGERNDGVVFSEAMLERMELALLGKPDAVKGVARQNLEYCKKAMSGESSVDAWQSGISSLARTLVEGDCKWPPLRYQQHDYLEIDQGWHFEGRVCKGDRIRIEVSAQDEYRLSDNGPWITAVGDLSQPALGDKYACTIEGCYAGTVIYRFTGEDGSVTIGPVGTGIRWEALQHGILHLQINDDGTWFDNTWRRKGSLVDHASIAYIGID